MAKNFTPQHKTAIKAVIDTIEWDGLTFADRELAGNIHVLTSSASEILNYPTITIFKSGISISVLDTAYNRIATTYTIRVFYPYQESISSSEDIIDELIDLIHTTFTDYLYGGNNETSWEQMDFGAVGDLRELSQGLVHKDITVTTYNTDERVTLPIPI